jgi:hypothetical protein
VPELLQASPAVQGFESASQVVPAEALVTWQVKVASPVETHTSETWHAKGAGQATGVVTQVPAALHLSPEVQPLPSVQAEPAAWGARPQTPVAGAQVLSWQAVVEGGQVFWEPTHAPPWQVAFTMHRLDGIEQVVLSATPMQGLLAGAKTKVVLAVRLETELFAVTVKVAVLALCAPAGAVQVPAVVKIGSRLSEAGVAVTKLVPVVVSTAHE